MQRAAIPQRAGRQHIARGDRDVLFAVHLTADRRGAHLRWTSGDSIKGRIDPENQRLSCVSMDARSDGRYLSAFR
jgi:hypothetical protein